MSTATLLIRQDPGFRVLPRGIVTALCVGLLFRAAPTLGRSLAGLNYDDLPGGFAPMYLVGMMLVLTFVFASNSWTRASRFSVGLPVSTRRAWLIRTAILVAVAVATVVPMALMFGVSRHGAALTLNTAIVLAALRATVTTVLLILLYQLPMGDRDRIPITAEYVIYLIFVTLIVVGFSAANITSLAGSVFLLVVAIGLGVWLFVRTPSTWSVGPSVEESNTPVWSSTDPDEDGEYGAAWSVERTMASTHPDRVVHWTLFRSLTRSIPLWIILVGIAGNMTVTTLEYFDGTNAYLALMLVIVWHLPVLQMSLERMTGFDPLPISRRALWAHTIGPAVVAMIAGVLLAEMMYRIKPYNWSPIHSQPCCVVVPWEYYEIASDGAPPTITAPWGESLTPSADVLWRGKRPALYNPYQVTAESSPRFVEYQLRRAVAVVYGVPPKHEVPAAYTYSSTSALSSGDFGPFIRDLTRGQRAEGRSRSAAVALMLSTVIMLALVVPALYQYGPSVRRKLFKWASWGGIIFLGVLALAIAVTRLAGYTEAWYVGVVVSIGIRRLADWLPASTELLWVLWMISWLATYLLLGSIFSRIELPGRSTVNRFAEEY